MDAILASAKNEAEDLIYPQSHIGVQQFCFFTLSDSLWLYEKPESLIERKIIYPQDALPGEISHMIDNAKSTYKKPYERTFLSNAIKLVKHNRYDTILMTKYSMVDYLNKNNLSDQFKLTGCVASQKIYLAFSPNQKKTKSIKQWIEIFEKEITQLKKLNYSQKLLKKYQLE